MIYDPFSSIKTSDGKPNILLSILPYLTDEMQDEIVKAINGIQNTHLQETLYSLGEQYLDAINKDYTEFDEYMRDLSLVKKFEDDELDGWWYNHHDPHADMMADIPD